MFSGLWSLFTMIGHAIIGLVAMLPALVGGVVIPLKNLFLGIAGAIGDAWNNRPSWLGGNGGNNDTPASTSYNGNTSRTMGLSSAIATENKMKPAGSHLVIANSSETVIPAYKGYSPGQMARPAFGGYGGGSMNVTNNFTINGGGMDPQALAEQVAAVVMNSVEEASYSEIYTS